jgi:hypothetical protein
VRLLRFAFIKLGGQSKDWRRFAIQYGGVAVSVINTEEIGSRLRLLVVADMPLSPDEQLRVDAERLVIVPEETRRAAEAALEAVANLVSLATGYSRTITSPNLQVAFRIETDDDRRFFASCSGLRGAELGVSAGRMSIYVDKEALAHLSDRQEGVALVAEALAQHHPTGRYHELLRVFEQAFAESADPLVPLLAAFLAQRPRLGYTKTEVKRWVVRLRGAATHADRHAPLLEEDLRDIIDRMLLAAYETVFNKQAWYSRDTARRDIWTPITGPLEPSGKWFVMQCRTEAPLKGQLFDPYGSYPLELGTAGLRLEDSCWPQRGPQETRAQQQPLVVLPSEELSIST